MAIERDPRDLLRFKVEYADSDKVVVEDQGLIQGLMLGKSSMIGSHAIHLAFREFIKCRAVTVHLLLAVPLNYLYIMPVWA